jgi:hypothetical protein
MKRMTKIKNPGISLSCLVLMLPMLLFLDRRKAETDDDKLPPEINAYYDEFNFVNSFSSLTERSELAGHLSEKSLPERFGDERLQKTFRLMKKIKSRVVLEDSDMVLWSKPGIDYLFPSELVRIERTQRGGGKIKAEVTVFYLEPKANLLLIAQYEKARGEESGLPSLKDRLSLAGPGLTHRQEIHTWVETGGEWKKQLANLVLIK